MAMLVFFAASMAAGIAVKGGAMAISQCFEPATSGENAEKNARVSDCVLYIFQLPAITRRRIHTSGQNKKKEEKDNADAPRPGRGRRRTQRIRREELSSSICW